MGVLFSTFPPSLQNNSDHSCMHILLFYFFPPCFIPTYHQKLQALWTFCIVVKIIRWSPQLQMTTNYSIQICVLFQNTNTVWESTLAFQHKITIWYYDYKTRKSKYSYLNKIKNDFTSTTDTHRTCFEGNSYIKVGELHEHWHYCLLK